MSFEVKNPAKNDEKSEISRKSKINCEAIFCGTLYVSVDIFLLMHFLMLGEYVWYLQHVLKGLFELKNSAKNDENSEFSTFLCKDPF